MMGFNNLDEQCAGETCAIKKDPLIDDLVQDDRTMAHVSRVKFQREYAQPDKYAAYGYFKGRLIIGRDTPINGGVYGGAGAREAIVVDDRTDGGVLFESYIDLYAQLATNWSGELKKSGVPNFLCKIYETVRGKMAYDNEKLDMLLADKQNDAEVHLSYFIQNKIGICRHQALFVAYLLEKLIQEKKLHGKVSVDRNSVAFMGAHAWARFTTADNKVFIIDPAQGYVGTLADVSNSAWFYQYINRPEVSDPAYFFIEQPRNPVGSADREFDRIIIQKPPMSEKEAVEREAETVLIPGRGEQMRKEEKERSAETVVSPLRAIQRIIAAQEERIADMVHSSPPVINNIKK